ncbi:DNA/RNA polymerase [Rhizoclosmatium globosum]|uniref:DNA/RNA polymerase n=1 Tax=Rhizoclosmatium globosum TaxID=329046 RepID=A0A1Y2D1A5_9FUNG|nr:DNA/RNA polymerase [Rhizoclosmatium globosum]|eukprot:ORY52916.1 DNA/RNA polymerase [Rhizoclosmatium globosum]
MLCNNDNNGDTEADMEINDWNEDDEGELGAEASDTRLECEVHSDEAAPHSATEPPPPPTTTTDSLLTASMLQNPNKAGTGGRSKDEINRIILEASKNSAYFKRQGEKAEKLNADICQLKERAAKLTAADLEASAAVVKTLVAARAATRDLSRTIVHVDMDAFYASVEELDRPDLKGKPMAVGGPKAGGTLCTANYEARKWGVRSAMATHIAQKLCPELVILKPNFEKYQKYSNLFATFSSNIMKSLLLHHWTKLISTSRNIFSNTQRQMRKKWSQECGHKFKKIRN